MRYRHRQHSLAGTCGVPLFGERVRVEVVADVATTGELVIRQIVWPGPPVRRFDVEAATERRPVGRADWGNLVRSWDVSIGKYRQRRILFWEDGEFFVKRKA